MGFSKNLIFFKENKVFSLTGPYIFCDNDFKQENKLEINVATQLC